MTAAREQIPAEAPAAALLVRHSPLERFGQAWHTYCQDRAALVGLLFVVLIAVVALAAPWISPYDPADAVAKRNALPGSEGVILGADGDGRDVLSRLIWGGRISLLVGIAPTLIAMVISLILGIAAGYAGRWLDQIIMRVLDVFFAFPLVLLAIVVAGMLEPGVTTVIIAITIALLPYITRLARTMTMTVKAQTYVEAARATGAGTLITIVRYVLPNVIAPVIVYTTTLIGLMMVVASGLSFLGLGTQPPAADWGVMVSDGRTVLSRAPHVTVFPGLLIVLAALGFNFIGDGLRDALDPRQRHR
jgi:ABC-type dipeptide/oligopeptide/nickel transport system permease subunit